MEIKVMKRVLDRNRDMAAVVRKLLAETKTSMVNIISSPGSGKTSLLERICENLEGKLKIAIIEGDVTTDRDAQRLKRYGVPVVLINTDGGCHLDSNSINLALKEFELGKIDVVFIENVGNLVCPAHFDLGEDFKMALVSTSEGDDKPAKYPMIFRESGVVVLNKTDLLQASGFDRSAFLADLENINPGVPFFELSCKTGEGLDGFMDWIFSSVSVPQKKIQHGS